MKLFLGIDVQASRDLSYFCTGDSGEPVACGWVHKIKDSLEVCQKIRRSGHELAAVGIDSPRQLLQSRRNWYWDGKSKGWKKRTTQKGRGRHCEVVLSAHKLASPQWTPLAQDAPVWMKKGVQLYEALQTEVATYEVFPSASYNLLKERQDLDVTLNLSSLGPGPKDMLDAAIAAITVREFSYGRGSSVGGGDSLGEIVLPMKLSAPISEVSSWPEKEAW